MKLKTMVLLFSAMNLLVACGGDKNDGLNDADTVVLVRQNDQGDSQIAIVDGSFSNGTDIQNFHDQNAQDIAWQDANQFAMDDELSLLPGDDVGAVHHRNNRRNTRHNRARRCRPGHGRIRYCAPRQTRFVTHFEQPRVQYVGRRCGFGQVLWRGVCCNFQSPSYNIHWEATWGWNYPVRYTRTTTTTVTQSWWYVRAYIPRDRGVWNL